MLEPIVVDAPKFFPHMCVQCHSQTGPLVDTHVENRMGDRVYVCASCVRRDGIALGLIKGAQHTRLLHAAQHESETGRELAAANTDRDSLRQQLAEASRHMTALNDDLANERQRSEQFRAALEDQIAAKQATLQAAG